MEKLPMCRICLVQNVRMYVVVHKNLQEIYEKLTDIPFVTEDSRPMLACFFCYTKLKQCGQLQRKCLEAEKLFAQMLNGDCKPNPLLNEVFEFFSGFIVTPTVHISIFDECQAESDDIKEELPDTCEGQGDIIEPQEEHQSGELELEYQDIEHLDSLTDQEDVIPDHSESEGISPHHFESEDYIPLMEFKSEIEREQEIAKNTERATVAKKPRRAKVDDTAEQKKSQPSDSNFIRTEPYCASEYVTKVKEPVTSANTTVTNCNIDKSKGKLNKPNIIEVTNNLSTAIDTHCRRNSNKDNLIRKLRNKKGINVNTHQGLCTGKKRFKCDICSRAFTTKWVLKQHGYTHTGEKPYKCGVCQRSFSQKSSLNTHVLQHTGEKPYKCDVCQRSFALKHSFKFHIRVHTGEKPYKCDICQHSFIKKNNLKIHIQTHTGEKPYKCGLCQRSFIDKSNFARHNQIHTGEKPYKCDICQRSFAQKSNLKNHTFIHTGEKKKINLSNVIYVSVAVVLLTKPI